MNKEPKEFKFFSHKECEFFPCHKTSNQNDFNCIFCYCPLYALGEKCGGNFVYTKNGVKDCSNCIFPHKRENYDAVIEKFGKIVKKTRGNI